MDIDKVRVNIRALRIMKDLDEGLQEKLADLFQSIGIPRTVPAGGVFIHEREHVDNKGYILLEGRVLVRKEGFQDVVCKAPELIGEIMQFNPAGVRTATCAGAVDSVVLRFMWDEFWERAEKALTEEELKLVRETLETQAWEHFLR